MFAKYKIEKIEVITHILTLYILFLIIWSDIFLFIYQRILKTESIQKIGV